MKKRIDIDKIERAIREIIIAIGEDPEREGLKDTPKRIANLYAELFKGLFYDAKKSIKIYKEEKYDEIIILKDIPFYSICEHHFLPFFGKVHIAYIPKDNKITGFSNIIEFIDITSRKPQIQERFTQEVADMMMDVLNPMGVLVIVEARQLCLEMQGLEKSGTITTTSAIRGAFKRESTRLEALNLIKGNGKN
jgi:GTP cyclohydrolase I|uniref:GTP cyclohydrolase 1 n=1 Tax=candidate division WOR-3 bacterium TaxID=2052148 RepID=A0A7C4U6E0_UNCW3